MATIGPAQLWRRSGQRRRPEAGCQRDWQCHGAVQIAWVVATEGGSLRVQGPADLPTRSRWHWLEPLLPPETPLSGVGKPYTMASQETVMQVTLGKFFRRSANGARDRVEDRRIEAKLV